MLDPHALDDVALDVHAQDVAGVQSHLVGVVGELDATGLAAAADLHLRLDHDGVPRSLGGRDGFVDRVGDAARRHRDVVAGEVLLALILEQVHCFPFSSDDSPSLSVSADFGAFTVFAFVECCLEPVGDALQ